jgi:hypothetical protein
MDPHNMNQPKLTKVNDINTLMNIKDKQPNTLFYQNSNDDKYLNKNSTSSFELKDGYRVLGIFINLEYLYLDERTQESNVVLRKDNGYQLEFKNKFNNYTFKCNKKTNSDCDSFITFIQNLDIYYDASSSAELYNGTITYLGGNRNNKLKYKSKNKLHKSSKSHKSNKSKKSRKSLTKH